VAPSVSFDRIADRYDETRGGLERGAEIARAIEPFVATAEWLLEVGIGTGAVANGFVERGRTVVGIDLSAEMLALAKARVGGRVARANAQALPVAGESVPAAYPQTLPGATNQPAQDLARWWRVFGDPQLDALIKQAALANLDLRLAQARVREARAQAGVFTRPSAEGGKGKRS